VHARTRKSNYPEYVPILASLKLLGSVRLIEKTHLTDPSGSTSRKSRKISKYARNNTANTITTHKKSNEGKNKKQVDNYSTQTGIYACPFQDSFISNRRIRASLHHQQCNYPNNQTAINRTERDVKALEIYSRGK
jgi:hypothetical protein